MQTIEVDPVRQEIVYPCHCGRVLRIPFASLVADEWADPCGCGTTVMFTAEQIAHWTGSRPATS